MASVLDDVDYQLSRDPAERDNYEHAKAFYDLNDTVGDVRRAAIRVELIGSDAEVAKAYEIEATGAKAISTYYGTSITVSLRNRETALLKATNALEAAFSIQAETEEHA